jgi:hypothetical protein
MGFEDDIFISYAHIDNQPLTEGQKGWISDFHRDLQRRVEELRRERTRIWRDEKLQGNDYFGDTIVERFPKVALLVSVLSPRYIKSKWCVRELEEFYKAAQTTGGVRIADKSRIFKVIKTPVPRNEYPQEVRELLGYEFYQLDQSGKPIEFNLRFNPEYTYKYWNKINDLAYDIQQMLDRFSNNSNGAVELTPIASTGTTIYLAQTTSDLIEERDKIRRELQQRGYIVLPEQSLPLYYPDFEQFVHKNLEDCKLSIHLIGARYGIVGGWR